MAGIVVKGLGYAHGRRSVSNEDMARTVDTSDRWIREKTGIRSRYFAEDRTNTDMACAAAEKAIASAGISREEIRWLIVCTFTPDDRTPSTACAAAGSLGLRQDVLALDINGACSGFIYGCELAGGLLHSRDGKGYALVIGSEKISPRMDMKDRITCVLFGDGAGAAVLAWDESAVFRFRGGCVPDRDVLYCDQKQGLIHMNGQEVYRFAVSRVPSEIRALMEENSLSEEDVDWYVLHQANERIIDSAVRRLGKPEKKFFKNLYHYGNTSAASIPIALSEMEEKGLLRGRKRILAVGFGAGLTYGSMYIEVDIEV